MSKATDQPTSISEAPQTPGEPSAPARSHAMTEHEVQALADRLFARDVPETLSDQPEMQTDMRIASRTLRGLLHKLDAAAGSVAETARLLTEITIIDVEA